MLTFAVIFLKQYAMETRLKKLPVGIQTFDEIRTDNYVYVDKT